MQITSIEIEVDVFIQMAWIICRGLYWKYIWKKEWNELNSKSQEMNEQKLVEKCFEPKKKFCIFIKLRQTKQNN